MKGQIKHSLVDVFREIIDLINHASWTAITEIPSLSHKKKPTSLPLKDVVVSAESILRNPERMILCRLFVTLFASLDTLKQSRNDLKEGAMYILLTRAGSILGTFVFGDDQSGNRQTILNRSTQIEDNNGPTGLLITMQTEARHIIWILERVMHLHGLPTARRLPNRTINAKTNKPPSKNSVPTAMEPLAYQAQIKLQNTLLKAIFGNDNTTFEERFRAPDDPGFDPGSDIAVVEEGNVKNWYKQEIWRLIGWDILQKSID